MAPYNDQIIDELKRIVANWRHEKTGTAKHLDYLDCFSSCHRCQIESLIQWYQKGNFYKNDVSPSVRQAHKEREMRQKLREEIKKQLPQECRYTHIIERIYSLVKLEILKARLDELIEIPIYPKGCHTPEDATNYVLRRIESVEKEITGQEKDVSPPPARS